MRTVVITTAFGEHDLPLRSCILVPGRQFKFIDMFLPGTGYTRHYVLYEQMRWVQRIFTAALYGDTEESECQIITHNFKQHLKSFTLPLRSGTNYCRYNVYDIPNYEQIALPELEAVARELAQVELLEYQRIIANSAVVYQEMENDGLKHNGLLCKPLWDNQHVVTGRASCSGFNIQGIQREDDVSHVIHHPADSEEAWLLHLDWIAADVRMVAYLSGDEALADSFQQSDPYQHLADRLGRSRGDCKQDLLSGIHGLRVDSDVFQIYTEVRRWILRCRTILDTPEGYLATILGRQFRAGTGAERYKLVSYIVQGSTAHAMQLAVRQMWEVPIVRVLADIHDSLVISCAGADLAQVAERTQEIMFRPFGSLLDISMPYRLSMCKVSKGWNNWQPVLECRNGRLLRLKHETARGEATAPTAAQTQAQAAETTPST